VHEFRKVIELAEALAALAFEIALQIHEGDAKDRAALERTAGGSSTPNPSRPTPQDFRRYVNPRRGIFRRAGLYVQTSSGWFSDRTIRYLATGRPAVVQSTGPLGFPVGEGCHTFARSTKPPRAVDASRGITSHALRRAASRL
jgi:hypothetical protein